MTALPRPRPASLLLPAVVLILTGPLYFFAQQHTKARRYEIGSMDGDFLAKRKEFYPPSRMSGPLRHADGSVEVIDFYGRVTARHAELTLPYHALRSPLRLFLRCHRFGLEGKVMLSVNGERLDEFVFGETSYPWGGIRTVIPEDVASRGPLRLVLVTEGGKRPPSHLPEAMGVGLDWIDVDPMSEGVSIRPALGEYIRLYLFFLGGYLFVLVTGATPRRAAIALAILLALVGVLTAFFPVETAVAIAHLVFVFPLAALLYFALRWVVPRAWEGGRPVREAAFAARLFALAVVYHSAIIFFPNHLPPDVPLHAVQVSWLETSDFSYRSLVEYSRIISRDITPEAVLMETGSDRGAEVEAPERSYGAPYPPFFYMLVFGLSRFDGDIRWTLEILAVVMASLMLVLVFLAAAAIWKSGTLARLASLLFLLEISVWHHANRGHAPGLFGALFVLLFLTWLVSFPGSLQRRSGLALFTVLTAVTALCYTVAFLQIGIFMTIFLLLSFFLGPRSDRRATVRLGVAFSVGIAAALALFYGPYVVTAVTPTRQNDVLLDRAADFDPPATFLFLRNQLRDTVRIYRNGHTLYIVLALAGLFLLSRSGATPYHRRILWASVGAYGLMLVLKDPVFLPRIFLHAKEDLFFSPVACLLAALPLAGLWGRRGLRPLVVLLFLALAALSLRDKAINTDTLHPQPLAALHHQRAEELFLG